MADRKFKVKINAESGILLSAETSQRALYTDASGNVKSSTVTQTELERLSGVSSDIQTQLNNKVDNSEKGANNGVATLDSGGKVPSSQLPNSIMDYKGTWAASTNTPTLANGTGNAGDVYVASDAGTVDFGAGNITFAAGDWVIYSGSIWEKSINSNAVVSVNGQTGVVSLSTSNISEGSNLYYTDERAQDAVGTILTDTTSIDFTYNDAGNTISAVVLPAGVDHNSLSNFVANEHIDHSSVSIATASDSGLSGGGDITTTRNLVVDINGTTAETVPANNDEILIWDSSASARRKMTRANFLSGIALSSPGDISETSFSAANNQSSAADVTGLAFANGVVRSFQAQVSVFIDATSDLFEVFNLQGIQKGSSWDMSIDSTGDASGIVFSITSAGQVQYQSSNISGFISNTIKFRATTTSI